MSWWHLYLAAGPVLALAYLANELRLDVQTGPSLRHGLRCTHKGTYLDVAGLTLPVINLTIVAVWLVLHGVRGWYRLRHRLQSAGLL